MSQNSFMPTSSTKKKKPASTMMTRAERKAAALMKNPSTAHFVKSGLEMTKNEEPFGMKNEAMEGE